MIPQSVLVRYDECRLALNLPIFFEEAPLVNIHKVLKLLEGRSYQNETAHEILDQFFSAWDQDMKECLERTTVEVTAAKQDAEDKRQIVAALGSTLDENIAQARQRLSHAKKRAKKRPGEVDEYKDALKKATRPKTDLQEAVKKIKRLEMTLKQTKAALERRNKVLTAYKELGTYKF